MTHHKNLNAARLHDGTIAFVLRAVAGDEQRLAAVELPKRDGRYGFSLVNPRNSLARLLADRFQRCEPGLRLHRRKCLRKLPSQNASTLVDEYDERHPLSLDELRLKSVLNHDDKAEETSPTIPVPGPVEEPEWKLVASWHTLFKELGLRQDTTHDTAGWSEEKPQQEDAVSLQVELFPTPRPVPD
ncbi:uncharacterized protein GGS25DRAFT_524663 [Hypoxylon fragiforme]|uniref:uncharacterized protein n=1 Tax=Hypoxylon fragiforme TaxID=63214 RepID=UPI0020C740AD|nr:uncharacterized protein GGS25DRAFT_524663 [Hypoxylon fragiforme]KAI2605147.1 hypothetical protein GGS25DRAFT_524663 [Hypoxylon fragiforme]